MRPAVVRRGAIQYPINRLAIKHVMARSFSGRMYGVTFITAAIMNDQPGGLMARP